MQYPIIDTIYQAYINNGWTGLDISTGKNLLDPDFNAYTSTFYYYIINDVVPENEVARFTFSDKDTSVDVTGCYIGFVHENLANVVNPINYNWAINNGNITTNPTNVSANDSSILCRNVFIYPNTPETFNKLFSRYNIMVELGTVATQYEPYKSPKTDIFSRLKLPLPHYFPHAVIDALQRAAAGTQTADDTEILRHYLTPLGIGGI